jgi:signal transduction histidine kinase
MANSGVSLRTSLPLLIGALVVLVIGSFSWASYQSVRQTVVAAANTRLSGVSEQIATSLETSVRQMRRTLDSAADKAPLRTYLRRPGKAAEPAALAALRAPVPNPQQLVGVELWDVGHHRLLAASIRPPGTGGEIDPDAWPGDSAGIGRLRALGDTLLYPTVVAVRDAGTTRGYLVQWRSIGATPQAQQMYSRLIGQNAGLYIGNDHADVWTDLSGPARGPPVDVRGKNGLVEYNRPNEGRRIGYARTLRGVPWIVLVDFSSNAVLSTAGDFLRHLAWLGAFVLALGLVAGWTLSRQITGPLAQLTAATEAVAIRGDLRPVRASRHAELARLATAFNTMAARVWESQKQLEQRVAIRTQELQERNEELEAFGYSISHDLRAPLRAMQGFSQILLDDFGPALGEEGRRYAQKIIVGSTRMDQLIRDLLAYSRISRDRIEASRVSLSQVVKEALDQLDAQLQESGANVKVQEPLPAVLGHGPTLSQVVANLVGNGVKFVPRDRKPQLQVRAEPRDGQVRLWVEDNGIGIKPEHLERIFKVFERLHASEEYPGTGIGLAIVRKGVERMGGKVGVESNPGEGSRFWIELPVVRSAA